MQKENSLKTVDVVRRWYGKRYTGLPVDTIDRRGFIIDCTESYMRPEMYDLQPDDVVRWVHDGQQLQGVIATVEYGDAIVTVSFKDVFTLPSDCYPYW